MNSHLKGQIKRLEAKLENYLNEDGRGCFGEDSAEITLSLYLEFLQEAIVTGETAMWEFNELKAKLNQMPLPKRRAIAKQYADGTFNDQTVAEIYDFLIGGK